MLDKKILHSIYLIKPSFVENNTYLQDVEDCRHYSIPIAGFPNAEVYLKTVPSRLHNWSKLLPAQVSGINWSDYQTRSLFGLLLIDVRGRLFALTSGFGRYLLHPFSVVNRFGFRAVLNSIEPHTIQQLSKTTLSQNPKTSIEQMSKGVNLGQFGIDGFLDLIQRVKGRSRIENLGLSLDGEDALKISVAYDLDQLPVLLTDCLALYESNDYQTFFPEVDNLSEVKDKEQKSLLDLNLENSLNNELDLFIDDKELSGDIWASIPEVIFDDDFECFIFKDSENALRYYDIELHNIFRERYVKRDGQKKRDISLASLANFQIYIRKSDGTTYPKWRAISCINAIVERDDEKFFYLEGKWFRASINYIDALDRKINNIPAAGLVFNDWPQHVLEKDYLALNPLTHDSDYLILDRNNINLEGQSPVEPCDIYTQDRILIHLKRYGSSSYLGHLFNQGFVSGDLLVNSIEFRVKFNEKLGRKFKFTEINPSDFTIAYVVGTKHPDNFKLPLFSKITLVKAFDELKKRGFKVTLDLCNMTLH